MTANRRRGRGEGGLYWDEKRRRFIAEVTIGYTPAGKRIVRRGSGKTRTEARVKLKKVMRDHEDGLALASHGGTVAETVEDFLVYGLAGLVQSTIDNYKTLAAQHIVPALGARKLRDLSAEDVDRWLADKAKALSTRTLRLLHSLLSRAVNRAMARDKVKRNVALLCSVPTGQEGRPSKSLTLDQAKAVIDAAERSRLCAYIVVSLLTGARTEELRALTWDHVDLEGNPNVDPTIPPSIEVWHSVRAGGDTKTRKSRRTLAQPARSVAALRRHQEHQGTDRKHAGRKWQETGLVFTSRNGRPLDAAGVRRAFRRVVELAGLDPGAWTPRELRHSFVSLLSHEGVPLEVIADLCGHAGTGTTGGVYRHQLRPVLLSGALAMDRIFTTQDAVTAG